MNIWVNQRSRGRSAARSILGVVLVAWLNLALQPCAMAFQPEQDPTCPHCPPEQSHHNHGGHGMVMVADPMPCATGASDCAVTTNLNHNDRSDQLKLKDIQKDLPAVIAPALVVFGDDQTVESSATSLSMNRPPGSSPPLHKLYCVYLD